MLRRAAALALTGALSYFLDPQNGARRRAEAQQRIQSLLRRTKQGVDQQAQQVQAQVASVAQKAAHPQSSQAPVTDDVTLARKVETEIFRDADVPKGQISVNAERGRVVLRGEVPSADLAERIEAQARKVPGVSEVESLLHTAGEPAPTSSPREPEEVKAELREPSPASGYGQSASSGGIGRQPGQGEGS